MNYDLVITDSEASKKDIIDILKIKKEKIKVVYPCLPKVFSKKNTKYEILNTKYCLYVGDATWNKNLVNLAKAIKLADVQCIFVGKVFEKLTSLNVQKLKSLKEEPFNLKTLKHLNLDNPWQKELKEFFELVKDDSRFIFKGFVIDKELMKLYQQAYINILPSRDEGFGFSYVEAAQIGCPSLLSDIPVLKEISGNNALFFNQKNPEDMANKIKKIYLNKDLRNKLIVDSKNRSRFFSHNNFRKEFLKIISF